MGMHSIWNDEYEAACEAFRDFDMTESQFRAKLRKLGFSVNDVNAEVDAVQEQQCQDAGR